MRFERVAKVAVILWYPYIIIGAKMKHLSMSNNSDSIQLKLNKTLRQTLSTVVNRKRPCRFKISLCIKSRNSPSKTGIVRHRDLGVS